MTRFLSCAMSAVCCMLLVACAPAAVEKAPPTSPAAPIASKPQPAANALPLTGISWAWQSTELDGIRSTATVPSRYILTFHDDNRLAVTADCNRGGSAYRLQDKTRATSALTLEPIATTKMLCPQGSQDALFLAGLRVVEAYRIDGQTLILQLPNGGQMVFTPQQP